MSYHRPSGIQKREKPPSLVWSGSNTPVMQGRHICAQSESERAASFPGVVPVGPCRCCLSTPSRRRRPGYRCPYTCIVTMLRERPHLGKSIVSSLLDRHHASHIASGSPGPVIESSFIVEHELGQGSRTPHNETTNTHAAYRLPCLSLSRQLLEEYLFSSVQFTKTTL
jgi:hypothetical protein